MTCSMPLVPVLYLALHAAQSIPAADDAGTLAVSDTATRPPELSLRKSVSLNSSCALTVAARSSGRGPDLP